jgi:hypothetical protein
LNHRQDLLLGGSLVVLAAGLAVVAALGPLTGGPVEYHVGETLRNQTIGLDAASLFVVAPLALVAALLTFRGHVAGPAMALGVGAYTAYMFVQYIVGPEYRTRPGNNEALFPLFLALFALGWGSALVSWQALATGRLAVSSRRASLVGKLVLPLLALVAFSRYLPALADVMDGDPQDAGYLAGPTFFWTIATLDLGVFLPATVATCLGLVRGADWAPRALYLVGGWFGLVGPAVAAMAIAMYVTDDPNASTGSAAFMTVLGLAFAALALTLYRPLFRRTHTRAPMSDGNGEPAAPPLLSRGPAGSRRGERQERRGKA